jgi:hypothetical protein
MKKTSYAARFAILFALTLAAGLAQTSLAADADRPAEKICEDFEGASQFTYWSNNGLWRVNSLGPSTEKAASGKRSLKIDVTWLDTSFDCWRPLPLYILYRVHLGKLVFLYDDVMMVKIAEKWFSFGG